MTASYPKGFDELKIPFLWLQPGKPASGFCREFPGSNLRRPENLWVWNRVFNPGWLPQWKPGRRKAGFGASVRVAGLRVALAIDDVHRAAVAAQGVQCRRPWVEGGPLGDAGKWRAAALASAGLERLLDTWILALGEANGAVHFEARCRLGERSWRSIDGRETASPCVQAVFRKEKRPGISRMKNPAR